MSDLYTAVKRGIEASLQVRARYDARFIDRATAIRHLSEIGLLTKPMKAELFLDRLEAVEEPKPWWKFWAKPRITLRYGPDHPNYGKD